MEAEQQISQEDSADYDLFGDQGLDYADGTSPFTEINWSTEDYNALFQTQQPGSYQWTDVESPNPYTTSATVDRAHLQLWAQGKMEIKFVRGKVKKRL